MGRYSVSGDGGGMEAMKARGATDAAAQHSREASHILDGIFNAITSHAAHGLSALTGLLGSCAGCMGG